MHARSAATMGAASGVGETPEAAEAGMRATRFGRRVMQRAEGGALAALALVEQRTAAFVGAAAAGVLLALLLRKLAVHRQPVVVRQLFALADLAPRLDEHPTVVVLECRAVR